MDYERDNRADFSLSKTFNDLAAINLRNFEVSALMGNIDPDSPGVLAGGINSRMGIPDKVRARILQKRNEQDFVDLLFQILILESIARLDAMIAMHEERMAEILEDIQAKNEALEMLDRQHEVIQGELEYYEEHGLFDLDDDGSLKNKEAEAIIAQWEADNGSSIDRSDSAAYDILLGILMEIDTERAILQQDVDVFKTEYEWRRAQRDEAIKIKADLENGSVSIQEDALKRYDNLFKFDGDSHHQAVDPLNGGNDGQTSQHSTTSGLSTNEAFRMNFESVEQSDQSGTGL